MAKGQVYHNGRLAGVLEKISAADYRFTYEDSYLADASNPSISLTLPRSQKEYTSNTLFSFFAGLLAEGVNKEIQCRLLKIDEANDFTRLLKTAADDTIGGVTIIELKD